MDIINIILEEIIAAVEAMKKNNIVVAYALYLDWKGDTSKLNRRDYGASCTLFWDEMAKYSISCQEDFRRKIGFAT